MTTQPEALRLADYLTDRNRLDLTCDEAAAELRRLHEVEKERGDLLALLKRLVSPKDDQYLTEHGLRNLARAAIAKAERTT